MDKLVAEYIVIVLNNLAFILFSYYLLRFISVKMKFREKRPVTAFRVGIIAGAFDLLLTLQYNLVMPSKTWLYLPLVLLEVIGFYVVVKNIYNANWKHSLSMALFLILAAILAQIAVMIAMLAFISMYMSV